jgi:succinylglutamate desuccinylase
VDKTRVAKEIEMFQRFSQKSKIGEHSIELLAEDAFVVRQLVAEQSTSEQELRALAKRDISLGLVALTHGNEVAGISILNEVLKLIESQKINLSFSVAFMLGDVPAARSGLRFMESDLNRSFGIQTSSTPAEFRAKCLEEIYLRTEFLIDFHQTQGPSLSAFFISRFELHSLDTFRRLLPACPAVTYSGGSFSEHGMTTLNFHLNNGGHGFGMELGEKGFDERQIALGVNMILDALNTGVHLQKRRFDQAIQTLDDQIYGFTGAVISKTGNFKLRPGFSNLTLIEKGQLIGQIDGEDLFLEEDVRLLFPKYLREGESGAPGTEVVRLLTSVSLQTLCEWSRK